MRHTCIAFLLLFCINNCFSQTIFCSEDFESTSSYFLPNNWSAAGNSFDGPWRTGWIGGQYSNGFGLSSAYFTLPIRPGNQRAVVTNDDGCNCNKSADTLIGPAINLSSAAAVELKFDLFFEEQIVLADTERLTLIYSTDAGSTWQKLTDVHGSHMETASGAPVSWHTIYYDLTAVAAGQSAFSFGFVFNDKGAWMYGAALDNLKLFEPLARDLAVKEARFPAFVAATDSVHCLIQNMGADTVNSFNAYYKVDGGPVLSLSKSGLNLARLDTLVCDFTQTVSGLMVGAHVLKVWTDNVNGSTDQNTLNDTVVIVFNMCSQLVPRKVLSEDFTSSSCPPSFNSNAVLNPLLFSRGVNTSSGSVCSVKYPVNYPSPVDPGYTTTSNIQMNYYSIAYVSHLLLNGGYDYSAVTTDVKNWNFDVAASKPSPVSITGLTFSFSGNVATVSGSVYSFMNRSGNTRVKIALVENSYGNSNGVTGTNGDTIWYQTMRAMVPDYKGKGIGNLTDGAVYNFNESFTFTGYTGPGTGTPKIFSSPANMTAVVWVQDSLTREVYQCEAAGAYTVVEEINSDFFALDVFPNPANDVLVVQAGLKNTASIQLQIFNELGEVVKEVSFNSLNAGLSKQILDVAELKNGFYFVKLAGKSGYQSRKFCISR